MDGLRSNYPPPRYIVVGYDPEHYGNEFIKDEDVVRPPNHMHVGFRTRKIPKDWVSGRSTGRCPSYGSCQICFMCGPVDECCSKCGEIARYLVANYGQHTIDSITLADILGAGKIRARANRTQAWIRTPMMNFTNNNIRRALDQNTSLTPEEMRNRAEEVYNILP